jgi:hypothetical protein
VSNDWGPDYLFRNDRGQGGVGRFTDVTKQVGADYLGFGMGASWGDYDNDGDQDLYVSNMYSKAGRRIAAQIDGLSPRIAGLAEGNFLLENAGSKLNQVAGLEPPALCVAKAGWSWGGQFADFNNDGFLDIYVSSGYFSVPTDYAIPVDL